MSEASELFEKVIVNNYCIGCGACATVPDSPFTVGLNEYGNMVAQPIKDLNSSNCSVLKICPFSDQAKNEDILSKEFFPDITVMDKRIGKYLKCFAGYVIEGRFREAGSSGGLGKWLGYTLLKEKEIDYLVHIQPNNTGNPSQPLFDYIRTSNENSVLDGSKSAYYPTSLIKVIQMIQNIHGKYAITGIPCYIKTLRLLSNEDQVLKSRIKYLIGIVCGGMKSANQSKIISWQLGLHPDHLVAIDFRRKHPNKPVSHKIYQVWSDNDDIERFRDSTEIYGTDWGSGFFKPNACDYCDDVVGETADISIGDAWLPEYENDPKGTSMVIVRNKQLLKLIEESLDSNKLKMDSLTVEDIAISQAGGLRHRREALSYRIGKKDKSRQWYPPKRVKPGEFRISRKRKKIYSLREKIASKSHIAAFEALKQNDYDIFFQEMGPLVKKYHTVLYGNLVVRAVRKATKLVIPKLMQLKSLLKNS